MRLRHHPCDLTDISFCSSDDDDDEEAGEYEERFLPESFIFIFITGRPLLSATSGCEGSGMLRDELLALLFLLLFLANAGAPCCSLQGNVTSFHLRNPTHNLTQR